MLYHFRADTDASVRRVALGTRTWQSGPPRSGRGPSPRVATYTEHALFVVARQPRATGTRCESRCPVPARCARGAIPEQNAEQQAAATAVEV